MALNHTNSSNMEQLALEGLIRISCAIACRPLNVITAAVLEFLGVLSAFLPFMAHKDGY